MKRMRRSWRRKPRGGRWVVSMVGMWDRFAFWCAVSTVDEHLVFGVRF